MPTTRSFIVPFLAIALPAIALFVAATPVDRGVSPAGAVAQDAPSLAPTGAGVEGRWNFALLQYRALGDESLHSVQARDLQKLWLIVPDNGNTILEMLFEDGSYKMVRVVEMLIQHRSGQAAARDVAVFRRGTSGVAFPKLD